MRCGILSVAFFVISWDFILAENTWALQLRRAAKRTHSAKKAGKGLSKSSEPTSTNAWLEAAESGGYGYSMRHKSHRYRPHYQPKYERYEYQPPRRRSAYSYASTGCYGHPPGTYGNPGYNCKVFHICQSDGRFDKMDCPASLRFNNYLGVCDWPNQVDSYCNPVYPNQQSYGRPQYRYEEEERPSYYPEHEMNYDAAEVQETRAKVTNQTQPKREPENIANSDLHVETDAKSVT